MFSDLTRRPVVYMPFLHLKKQKFRKGKDFTLLLGGMGVEVRT